LKDSTESIQQAAVWDIDQYLRQTALIGYETYHEIIMRRTINEVDGSHEVFPHEQSCVLEAGHSPRQGRKCMFITLPTGEFARLDKVRDSRIQITELERPVVKRVFAFGGLGTGLLAPAPPPPTQSCGRSSRGGSLLVSAQQSLPLA
jgi:hypothetical protein